MTNADVSSEPSAEQQDTTNLLERLLGRAIADRHLDFFAGELGSIGHGARTIKSTPLWLFDRLLRMLHSGFVPALASNVVEWLSKVRKTRVDRAIEVLEALLTNRSVDQWIYVGQDQWRAWSKKTAQ